MTQKIIQVGKSAAVTLPKEFLRRVGWKVGARVHVETNERSGTVTILSSKGARPQRSVSPAFARWLDRFIEAHRPALEELAKK